MSVKTLRIGTRGSQLALWQAYWIKSQLENLYPDFSIALEVIKTSGDKIRDVPLAQVGGKGLFVKEIEQALIDGRIDLAVHSMKDMPGVLPEALCIGVIPKRETPYDILISRGNKRIKDLPAGARIGTSSYRRASQMLYRHPDFKIQPLRGNLDTRIKKLTSENLDAVILAGAGVKRLNLEHMVSEYIDPDIIMPAVGQGALCVEVRKNDPSIHELIAPLDHEASNRIVTSERAFLKQLEGGCQVPMAAFGRIERDVLTLAGMVAETDGSIMYHDTVSGAVSRAETIGRDLAKRLIERGAGRIIARLSEEAHP